MHAPAAALLAGVALTTAPCVAATPASQAVRYWPGDATSDLHTGFTSAGMQDDMIVVDPEDVVEDFALVGTRKLLHGCHRLACDSGHSAFLPCLRFMLPFTGSRVVAQPQGPASYRQMLACMQHRPGVVQIWQTWPPHALQSALAIHAGAEL